VTTAIAFCSITNNHASWQQCCAGNCFLITVVISDSDRLDIHSSQDPSRASGVGPLSVEKSGGRRYPNSSAALTSEAIEDAPWFEVTVISVKSTFKVPRASSSPTLRTWTSATLKLSSIVARIRATSALTSPLPLAPTKIRRDTPRRSTASSASPPMSGDTSSQLAAALSLRPFSLRASVATNRRHGPASAVRIRLLTYQNDSLDSSLSTTCSEDVASTRRCEGEGSSRPSNELLIANWARLAAHVSKFGTTSAVTCPFTGLGQLRLRGLCDTPVPEGV
jgi:hypothetical protein